MSDKMTRGRTETVSDDELFEAIRTVDGPAFGANEVAAAVGEQIGRERCRQRLNKLATDGLLNKKKIGGMNVYWIQSPVSIASASA